MTESRDTKPNDGACPEDEAFVRAFMDEASVHDKDRLVTHVMNCPLCRRKFDALRQARTELKAMESAPVHRSSLFRINRRLVAVCGLTLLLAGAALILSLQNRDTGYRGNEAGRLVLTEPKGNLTSPPSMFIWTPVKGTDSYEFKLIDDDLNTIIHTQVRMPRIVLTDAVRAKLAKGKKYVWTIDVRDDDGRLLDSASSSFELK